MAYVVLIWLLVVAFAGAGLVNGLGVAKTRENLIRWGYPRWWCHFTGGLELAVAVLIALPASRLFGLVLGAAVIAAAILTVLRHRDYSHLRRSACSSPCWPSAGFFDLKCVPDVQDHHRDDPQE